jgi:uncharacterized protein YcgI (DUF1989 family)
MTEVAAVASKPGVVTGTVPARRGKAVRVDAGKTIKIVNTHGQQVVDTWAFNAHDPSEHMSMEHSRTRLSKITPRIGDTLVTNRRRPILTLVGDSTIRGTHDTLVAACDRYRYEQLGAAGYHDNCTDNLAAALKAIDLNGLETPCPLNLFMNVSVAQDGSLQFLPPLNQPGGYVSLRAEMDVIVAFSACPQDMVPVNGEAMIPRDVSFSIE